MDDVPKRFRKVPVSARVNAHNLDLLDKLGEATGRNRSEMLDRAIEEYVRTHAAELPPQHTPRKRD